MLYQKYRPSTFEEIIGHKDVVSSLKGLLKSNDMPHAFIFNGTSGCGKTTIARIIAKELKGEITEINIANTSGIDFIRDLDT